MKKVTTITVSALKSGQSQIFDVFDNYDIFEMCIGFWGSIGSDSDYAAFRKMYEASRDLMCKVELESAEPIITFETKCE